MPQVDYLAKKHNKQLGKLVAHAGKVTVLTIPALKHPLTVSCRHCNCQDQSNSISNLRSTALLVACMPLIPCFLHNCKWRLHFDAFPTYPPQCFGGSLAAYTTILSRCQPALGVHTHHTAPPQIRLYLILGPSDILVHSATTVAGLHC